MTPAERDALVKRISEIEDAIAAGTMDAAQVFTQMRRLLTAQPSAGEPVAWVYVVNGKWTHMHYDSEPPPDDAYDDGTLRPLYAHPAPSNPVADRGAQLEELLGELESIQAGYEMAGENESRRLDAERHECRRKIRALFASSAPTESSPETVVVPREIYKAKEIVVEKVFDGHAVLIIFNSGAEGQALAEDAAAALTAMLAASPGAQKGES